MPTPPSPLSRALLAADAWPAAEVSFGRDGKRTLADLHHGVAVLATRIRERGAGRWLLHTEDSFAGCVGLLALAHAGATAVLPPNRQPETLARLASDCVGALLAPALDAPEGLAVLDPLEPSGAAPLALGPLDGEAVVAELFTSGTTGAGARVEKRVRHLEDEIAVLERHLGPQLGEGARVFATVSHQHIYGLLFRMLWPLASRRPFCAETPLHGQELLPRLLGSQAAVLVASPVHLRSLAADPQLPKARGTCRAVFSSGGPLDAETAAALAEALGRAPIEVLGSTETGGVAVRRRDGPDAERWRPLPEVRIECDDVADPRLVVTSPFVSCGEAGPGTLARFEMGDRVRLLADGSFELLARADRTVKIAGKRLALPELERALEAHPWVAEAALVVAPRGGELRVHAAVVPTPEGVAALRDASRRDVGAALAEHLASSWDRVLLPRAWRFVDVLPRDSQGKLPVAALRALFDAPAGAPRIESEHVGPGRIERELFVPPDLAGIEGHFEGFPVVPGVMQVGWALDAAERLLGERPRVRSLEAVKFPTLLHPDSRVRVEVELEGERLRFSLCRGHEVTASGRCRLGEASLP